MDNWGIQLWNVIKSDLLVTVALLLGGVLLSCILAGVLVGFRRRRGRLKRPFELWTFCSRLLLWSTLSALGIVASVGGAALYGTQRVLTDVGTVVQQFTEAYVGGLQRDVNSLLGRPRNSGYTINALVGDLSEMSSSDSPIADNLVSQLNTGVVQMALSRAGMQLGDEQLPQDLNRLDLTNISGSVVHIAQNRAKEALLLASVPIIAVVKIWLIVLLIWAACDKLLSLLVYAIMRRSAAA